MKKLLPLLLAVVLMTGCSQTPKEVERALSLRSKLLQANSCTFDAEITADYGETLHVFRMNCTADPQGGVTFQVTAPESIAGITGQVSKQGGALTFDDTALYFDLLADEQLSPVSAPWVLIKALRGGFITSAGMEDDELRFSVNDSYEDDALNLDVWLDSGDIPQRADICYAGKRILSLKLENVQIS
ncbi:MAG: hypothetical protein Q4F81_13420 [Eubacteriales bacterium]|nr:hypothetical protein [Eubacteriales bacterium]